MHIFFTPQFKRQFRKLPAPLQEETIEKIELFKDPKNHKQLKVHKLKGTFKKHHSFSVNYQYRILFQYLDKDKSEAVLLVIGDHDVYKD